MNEPQEDHLGEAPTTNDPNRLSQSRKEQTIAKGTTIGEK